MVHGLEKFKDYFEDFTSNYVFIGGVACDILMEDIGTSFRATKDLDIVLIIEVLDSSFGEIFWKFIEDGGYKYRGKSEGENKFYRFKNPAHSSFPKMIELFSKQPTNMKLRFDKGLTPIHIDDDILSLSAILLNDVYYDLLLNGKCVVDGYSLIEVEIIILFKIKAWLDMMNRKEAGEKVDEKNIKKHKNDVFRLLTIVSPIKKVPIVEEIRKDLNQFINEIQDDQPDLKNLGIKNVNLDEMIEILENIYR